ncbi:MAG: bifunctional phosphopantothenoylcysteine decarboxylase/phosphopantothenate--cysteine ligase CoaBC [Bacteroidia bacterium]|nr:bifunctional phosphopantothenoylcysteine decarboxylase/phosphopantothenate--cysteine ligase CoaBC [Bacteroidia bacterium]MCZ2277308.1 bifunctional phosphopantothenoylcysteine decarboxylase/phosphopantothenate--cysteine ligase CoaBC [Bacteroidia bacterium]
MQLTGKRILIGVTGSIAACKIPELVRLLIKEGAEVRVVMTPSSSDFVTPQTLSVLSRQAVYSKFYHPDGSWVNHVELGLWAELLVIAPASAHSIAKMANGICDNLLLSVYLSARCPVLIAPAMDMDMFLHHSTQRNLKMLVSYGHQLTGPSKGELASGLEGPGRMEEPEIIFSKILQYFTGLQKKRKKKVLISCGPTREAIDPVRFISNRSSGKMGLALASEFEKYGYSVTVVAGAGVEKPASLNAEFISVETASQMYQACMNFFPLSNIIIMAAAVADYTILEPEKNKIKKEGKKAFQLTLSPTVDILSEMGKRKTRQQFLVGFALESNNEEKNAVRKLKEKNLDMIVLNSLNDKGAGFEIDTNKITIISRNKKKVSFSLKLKTEVASDIFSFIQQQVHA